jgi:hypothetical protein
MLNAVQNIIANPTFYQFTQGTAAQMGIKTSLNAIGRPTFILADKNIDSHTKKFSASKEFLYQAISLALYLGIIIPIFKKGAFSMAKKIFKDEAVFKAFKTPEEFKAFNKLSKEEKASKIAEINTKTGDTFTYEIKQAGKDLTKNNRHKIINADSEDLANGVIESSSLVGTVLGLAIIAPMTASKLIHPILKAVGIETKSQDKTN